MEQADVNANRLSVALVDGNEPVPFFLLLLRHPRIPVPHHRAAVEHTEEELDHHEEAEHHSGEDAPHPTLDMVDEADVEVLVHDVRLREGQCICCAHGRVANPASAQNRKHRNGDGRIREGDERDWP